ncbi:MAG: MerR family transcriptional regulator [Sphingomonadaceae bacterium]|uniref:MerR family transcriptional regulator n=1 Tax=Thermaurantiacus sp. TaxID=2820283 RepID=UPI00298ED54D|nr:MerR family transcriptional regulator [Thermaurantiacus sp.]MCS6987110.1 MerR family transcriptional regulator [Sphingomonadaceae bacterium]MDW8415552.1 MerR family transcriptional regulator [Thermaurantiacus sp.]
MDEDAGGGTSKAPGAFRTISEVSAELGVPQHVLRFWETRFPELRPLKRGGNRRYYRLEDVALCRLLHRLLHVEGYTVKGVQALLRRHGVKALLAAREGAPPWAGDDPASVVGRLAVLRDRLAAALDPPGGGMTS